MLIHGEVHQINLLAQFLKSAHVGIVGTFQEDFLYFHAAGLNLPQAPCKTNTVLKLNCYRSISLSCYILRYSAYYSDRRKYIDTMCSMHVAYEGLRA